MIDAAAVDHLKEAIADCVGVDRGVLDELRGEILPLKSLVRRIQPRCATSISLVGTDGGNNQVEFDPFLVQLIRVVDSSENEYCLEAVSPATPVEKLDGRQFFADGTPKTALGEMMVYLGVRSLSQLSPMIRKSAGGPVSPSWVQVYRELIEWAILFSVLKKDFASDTLIVYDGLLRSKVFARDLFQRLLQGIKDRIQTRWNENRRHIYLVGVAKHSKVLDRYRLAMILEDVLQTDYPAYVEVPRNVEEKAYIWSEFARGDDFAGKGTEINKFVGGKMFLVKFGARKQDPIWPIDIFVPQSPDSQIVLGGLLADAVDGFPVPYYPRCLQKAHESAALVDFDSDILQDCIYESVRSILGENAMVLDIFRLREKDPAQRRY